MKPNSLIKIGQWFYYALMAISVILVVIFYLNNGNVNTDDSTSKQMADLGPVLNYYIFWAYVLLGIAAIFSLIFPLFRMIGNPKSGVKTLISVVILAVVLLIAYQLGDDTLLNLPGYDGNDNVAERLKMTDMAIFTMYALLAGALLAMLFSSVRRLFN